MNNEFMELAIKVAMQSGAEVPIGAVIVKEGKIIAKASNKVMQQEVATLHAEMIAIEKASKFLKTRVLESCDIYITLEPCTMCSYAICLAKIRSIYFGASDPKKGAISCGNFGDKSYNHIPKIYSGIKKEENKNLLQNFFKNLR